MKKLLKHSDIIKLSWGKLYEKYKYDIDKNGRCLKSIIEKSDYDIKSFKELKIEKIDGDNIHYITKVYPSIMVSNN